MSDVVIYRDNQLTISDFDKINNVIADKVFFKPKFQRIVYTEKDEYGDMVERVDYVDAGFDVQILEELPQAVIDSIQRPARKSHMAAHLKRLELHKRYARGSAAWDLIIEDICNDLDGVSEYAVIKACEKFRLDTESPFFPDTGKLVNLIKDLDCSFKNMKSKQSATEKDTVVEKQVIVKTEKSKRRVSKLVKIGMKADTIRTKWEKRWFEAMGKIGTLEQTKTEKRVYHEN